MNDTRLFVLSAVSAMVVSTSSALAAPCESVESAAASTAYQKVDTLLSERVVADQLQAIGLSQQQAQARLSQLSEQQLVQLAAHADMIRAGGTIQDGKVNQLGPLSYMWHQTCSFFKNVYRLVFCWTDLK